MNADTLKLAKMLLIVVGCFVLASLVRTFMQSPTDPVTESSQAILNLHASVVKRVEAARKMERAYHARGVQLRAFADSQVDPGTKVVFLERACDAFSLEASACQERAELLQIRNDTLEAALARQIHVSQCKVLFIRCPSRFQTFALGVLLGGAGGYALFK